MSHVPSWCESILGLKVEAVQGKQFSLEWTETSGGLWEWWHDAGVPLGTELYNLQHDLILDHFHYHLENIILISHHSPDPSFPIPWQPTNTLSISLSFHSLDSHMHGMNHSVYFPL